jgi:hypothetical protein
MKTRPDARGHFGRFGGRDVPETLMARLVEEHLDDPSLVLAVGDVIASPKEPRRKPGATPKSR